MLVTASGILIEVRLEHLIKAFGPISVMLSGRVILVKLEQSSNADATIPVMGLSLIHI